MSNLRKATFHPETLVEMLRQRAANNPEATAFVFLVDGEGDEQRITYGELDRRARAVGASLQSKGLTAQNVVLLFPPGIDYIVGFFGCMYGGAVPVPAYPPNPARMARTLPRLQGIVHDCDAKWFLSNREVMFLAQGLAQVAPSLQSMQWQAVDDLPMGIERAWQPPPIHKKTLAFLQYTSGSTGEPKGVMLSHRNVLANLRMIARGMALDDREVGFSWLPMYHDMGLVGHMLQPIYVGRPCVLMSPLHFLQRPFRWLQAITRYKVTTTGGPNFAFDLCVRKITAQQKQSLDLSSWRVAYCGAEPVRPATLSDFADRFVGCGFQRKAFFPCYGLAEATLFVSGGAVSSGSQVHHLDKEALEHNEVRPARGASATQLIVCGETAPETEVCIVDPVSRLRCGPGRVGEIWVSSPSTAYGYWNRPNESRATFRARLQGGGGKRFLRTGDLGFLHNGRLTVTGRLKDLIILSGRNHYPQDIERTVERSHPSLRAGCCAAFSAERDGQEMLVVAVEVERRSGSDRRSKQTVAVERRQSAERRQRTPDPVANGGEPTVFDEDEAIAAVRRAVWETHSVTVHAIAFLSAGSIPKTSSGKIQRGACRRAYLNNEMSFVANWSAPLRKNVPYVAPRNTVETELSEIWAEVLDLARVGVEDNFFHLGGQSLQAAQIAARIQERFDVDVSLRAFFDTPTVAMAAKALIEERKRKALEAGDRTTAVRLALGLEEEGDVGEIVTAVTSIEELRPAKNTPTSDEPVSEIRPSADSLSRKADSDDDEAPASGSQAGPSGTHR